MGRNIERKAFSERWGAKISFLERKDNLPEGERKLGPPPGFARQINFLGCWASPRILDFFGLEKPIFEHDLLMEQYAESFCPFFDCHQVWIITILVVLRFRVFIPPERYIPSWLYLA